MTAGIDPSAYLPDRPPTWTEVALSGLVIVTYVPVVVAGPARSWPAVLGGFLAFALALGPGANSALGRRVGAWFRGIGVAGRAAAIGLFAAAVGASYRSGLVPPELLSDVGFGGILAVLLYVAAHLAVAREVSGWHPRRGRPE